MEIQVYFILHTSRPSILYHVKATMTDLHYLTPQGKGKIKSRS